MAEDTSPLVDYATVPLPQKPRLAPWVTCVDLGDSRLQLRGAEFSFTLQHPLFIETFHSLHPLLDGQHTVEEIISSSDPKFLPTTITFLLKMLRANGALQEGNLTPPPPLTPEIIEKHESQIQFFSHFVLDPVSTLALIQKARVALTGSCSMKHLILQALRETGFASLIEIESPNTTKEESLSKTPKFSGSQLQEVDLLIACLDVPDHMFFQAVNASCLETDTRWMHVSLSGTRGLMGPTIIPRQSACYACYDKRVASNATDLQSYLAYQIQRKPNVSEGYLNPLASSLAQQVSLEVSRIISGFAPPKTIGRLYEFEATSPLVKDHDVLRLPRCPACNLVEPRREPWDMIHLNP
ncbi:MAG: TOMM precursor leader peptide-binding protein [Nitrospinota bacterium]|nr:TOMM precursor leader peptide-binding protein [Nitrospinota bacterium]